MCVEQWWNDDYQGKEKKICVKPGPVIHCESVLKLPRVKPEALQ
jgi:hypothetical protein